MQELQQGDVQEYIVTHPRTGERFDILPWLDYIGSEFSFKEEINLRVKHLNRHIRFFSTLTVTSPDIETQNSANSLLNSMYKEQDALNSITFIKKGGNNA